MITFIFVKEVKIVQIKFITSINWWLPTMWNGNERHAFIDRKDSQHFNFSYKQIKQMRWTGEKGSQPGCWPGAQDQKRPILNKTKKLKQNKSINKDIFSTVCSKITTQILALTIYIVLGIYGVISAIIEFSIWDNPSYKFCTKEGAGEFFGRH